MVNLSIPSMSLGSRLQFVHISARPHKFPFAWVLDAMLSNALFTDALSDILATNVETLVSGYDAVIFSLLARNFVSVLHSNEMLLAPDLAYASAMYSRIPLPPPLIRCVFLCLKDAQMQGRFGRTVGSLGMVVLDRRRQRHFKASVYDCGATVITEDWPFVVSLLQNL